MTGPTVRKIKKSQPRPFDEAVGARVARLREAMGFGGHGGQTAFARQLGIAANRLNMIESGERGLAPEMALELRRFSGVTLEWLYAGEGGALLPELRQKLFPPLTKM